jgi:hypothetical protein
VITTNSLGQPIASSDKGIENFWNWFGDSKCIDEQGRPLVFYHGSRSKEKFTSFDKTLPHLMPDRTVPVGGIFFTTDGKAAYGYKKGGHIVNCYLKIESPLYTASLIKKYRRDKKLNLSFSDAKRKAVAQFSSSHDGIIFTGDNFNSDEYVVFDNTQIKSLDNNGEFAIQTNNINEAFKISPEDAEKIYQKENISVYKINSKIAAQKYGANTTWCINSKEDYHWNLYRNQSPDNQFYIIINKDLPSTNNLYKVAVYVKSNDIFFPYGALDKNACMTRGEFFAYLHKEHIPFSIFKTRSGEDVSIVESTDTDQLLNLITTNSLGQPIHSTQEGIENFWKWFGDSKIVDEQGRPLVCYHGSHDPTITKFDVKKSGTIQKSDWGEGIYFSLSKSSGNYYRQEALKATSTTLNKLYDEYEAAAKEMGTTPMGKSIDLGFNSEKYKELQKYEDRWREALDDINKNSSDGKVYSAYLKISKPYRSSYHGITDPYLSKYAQEKGSDGIIIGDYEEILVFDSSQIKTIDNNGNFNPHSKNINENKMNTFQEMVSEIKLTEIEEFGDEFDNNVIEFNPNFHIMYESNVVHDERKNKTADKFFTGTRNNHLYLRDGVSYEYKFDNQMIVNTKDKTLEFPKRDIESYKLQTFHSDVYTADKWYANKLFKDLLKHGIIDDSYSIRHDIEKDYNTSDLVLYHGTSSSVLDRIKTVGLKPIDSKELEKTYLSNYRGNNSTINEHTENNIYLTANKQLAIMYAKNQAKVRKDTPILIKVSIPNISKLIVDDDYIIKQLHDIHNSVYFEIMDSTEQEIFQKLQYDNTFITAAILQDKENIDRIASQFTNKNLIVGFILYIKEQYDKLLSTNYVKSLISQYQAVAYRGRIPAKFLSFEEIQIREPVIKENKFKKFVRKVDDMNVYQKMLSEIRLTELDEFGQEDILQNDSIETTGAFSKETEEEPPIEDVEEEGEVEPQGKVRLLTIDRKNINKELKELLREPKSIFPLTQIKTIINKYDIKPIDDDGSEIEIKLKGTDGDLDFTLASKDDRMISNSALIVYWHKNEDGTYNFNVYCS